MKSFKKNKQFDIRQLVWEGVWNEISSEIQTWRKKLKVDLSDKIRITFSIGTPTDCFCCLQAIKQDEDQPYGVDSRSFDLQSFVGLSNQKLYQEDLFPLLEEGAKFISDRIHLDRFTVNDNARNLSVEYS